MKRNLPFLPLFTPLIIFALALPPLGAAGKGPGIKTEVDWFRGLVSLEITAPLPPSAAPMPVVKLQLQKELESRFLLDFKSALGPLLVDSRRNLAQALLEEPPLLAALTQVGEGLISIRIHLTKDMKSLRLSYQVNLFPDIIRPLSPGGNPDSLPLQMGYEPSAPFTGLVIYAADSLPVHGERDERGETLEGFIAPCLLPRLYDEGMNLIFSADNMADSYRESWGVFQYTPSLQDNDHNSRVGNYPFYTMAVGLFGIHNTDLILSTEASRKLLAREETRRLLREGRIIVITPGASRKPL